jgi:hypothetical protein
MLNYGNLIYGITQHHMILPRIPRNLLYPIYALDRGSGFHPSDGIPCRTAQYSTQKTRVKNVFSVPLTHINDAGTTLQAGRLRVQDPMKRMILSIYL